MNFIQQIITNKYIYIPFLLWFFIQLFKVIWDLVETKKFNFKRIMGAGGMPSSHSAVVTSLTTLIGKNEGFESPIFALSLIFAFIVMYDAAGVRRAAGKQARLLNKIVETPGLTRTSSNRKTSRSTRTYTTSSICRSINRNNSRSIIIKGGIPMTDIEIARDIKPQPIEKIAKKLNIKEEYIESYGKNKAKISNDIFKELEDKQNGKLILVTSINPTPLGEGKTTMSIGIADGLNKIGKSAMLALREPSIGPVFGIKGGATGGGYSQIIPMEEINLHFTGDMHAITSANNLLSSLIDNHIYYGNELNIKKVTWKRCMDLNERQLRKIETGLSGEKAIVPRQDEFQITAASEIMAILCLSENLEDLKEKLGNILIGYNKDDKPVFAKDLKAEGAMTVLLKDAIKPNLVQTLEGTPAFVHGGPFANIAHGCNTIIATKMALKLASYAITEAGFGADLGAEKFLDLKCRKASLQPDAVVCVATLKALKYYGGVEKENIYEKDIEALKIGSKNLLKHIDNLKNKFGMNVIVAINKHIKDDNEEIELLKDILNKENVELSLVQSWEKGGEGAKDIAQKLVELCEKPCKLNYTYNLEDTIEQKIEKVCKNIYGAKDIEYSKEALEEIKKIENIGYNHFPICIAKTQYSFSDDAKNLKCEQDFNIHIKEVRVNVGAGFIVVITGKIMTMPGLPKVPAANNIDIDKDGNIIGIF